MKTKHNRGVNIKAVIDQLEGLDRAVLQVLRHYVGRENALPRKDLVQAIRQNPIYKSVDERHVRLAIHELRQSGMALVCSTGGKGGGYWLAAGWDEVDAFIDREVDPRAKGLLATKKAMLAAAGRQFGPKPLARQETLL